MGSCVGYLPVISHVIGVDAGGTKTAAALATIQDSDIEIIGQITGGPGNPHKQGPDTAYANVCDVLNELLIACDLAADLVKVVYVGMAGCGDSLTQEQARSFLCDKLGFRHVLVVPDYELVIPQDCKNGSVALISGTGSVAFGRFGNREAKSGGQRFNDVGSGSWIANKLVDELIESNFADKSLWNQTKKALANDKAKEVCRQIHLRKIAMPKLAEVVTAERNRSEMASRIVQDAAKGLAQLVIQVVSDLKLNCNRFDIGMGGSVLTQTATIRNELISQLESNGIVTQAISIVKSPERNAIQLAIRAVKS